MRKFVVGCKMITDATNTGEKASFAMIAKMYILSRASSLPDNFLSFRCEFPQALLRHNIFDKQVCDSLQRMFTSYCGISTKRVCTTGKSVSRLKVGNSIVCVNRYRGGSPYSHVIAKWLNEDDNTFCLRPAIVKDIWEVKILAGSEFELHWVVHLDWYRYHENVDFYGYNSAMKIWSCLYEPHGLNSFIPARCIKGYFVSSKEEVKLPHNDTVNIVIQLPMKSIL